MKLLMETKLNSSASNEQKSTEHVSALPAVTIEFFIIKRNLTIEFFPNGSTEFSYY